MAAAPKPHRSPTEAKFTQALADKFVEIVRRGNFRETACAQVGVDPSTMRKWLRAAANGDRRFTKFVRALDEAEAEAEDVMVAAVRVAAKNDWRAAAWYLERRGPKRWGFRAGVEVSVKEEITRVIDVVEQQLGPEAAARVFTALADGTAGTGTLGGDGPAEGGPAPGGSEPIH